MRWKGDKGKAWEAVRRYIKANEKHCYTCPAQNLEGINAQAGHYKTVALVGSNNTRSWDERFIHLQCYRCNGVGQGMAVEYRKHLVADYGEEVVADFDANYRKISPIKNWPAMITHYDSLLQSSQTENRV